MMWQLASPRECDSRAIFEAEITVYTLTKKLYSIYSTAYTGQLYLMWEVGDYIRV